MYITGFMYVNKNDPKRSYIMISPFMYEGELEKRIRGYINRIFDEGEFETMRQSAVDNLYCVVSNMSTSDFDSIKDLILSLISNDISHENTQYISKNIKQEEKLFVVFLNKKIYYDDYNFEIFETEDEVNDYVKIQLTNYMKEKENTNSAVVGECHFKYSVHYIDNVKLTEIKLFE